MKTKEQEYRQVRKAARQANREAQKALEEQQRQINAQQHQLREEFKQRMKALHDMYNKPTEHSIQSHRLRDAHNIKRILDKTISQWKAAYLDAENAQVQFEMKETHIAMSVVIPFQVV